MELANISTPKLLEEIFKRDGVKFSRIDAEDNTQLVELRWDKFQKMDKLEGF